MLTSNEIQDLMQAARKLGATQFKCGEVEVQFALESDAAKEEINPRTGLTPSEERDLFASSEG